MPDVDLLYAFGLAPEKAVEYFRSKGYKIGWDWTETLGDAHAKAFTVARVMQVEVLQDIREALDRALSEGTTLEQFKKNLIPLLQQKGWWGEIVNEQTGELAWVDARRLNTIYQTNLQTSYMAGQYKSMMANVKDRPYWMYVAVMDGRTRPAHRALHGKVFRYDDPIWQYIYPPNGFRCRCRVRALSAAEVAAMGLTVDSSDGRLDFIDVPFGNTGETVRSARYRGTDDQGRPFTFSPDPGWSYNPGQAWQAPFTPPPLDTLPKTFPAGASLPDLPTPERLPASLRLPQGLKEEEYYQKFLEQFPAETAATGVFEDVAGDAVVVTDDLFRDNRGNMKILKNGRQMEIAYLARTITNPDEIWLSWQPVGPVPEYSLRRRYIKRIELDGPGGLVAGIGVFEEGENGWMGVTVFDPKDEVVRRSGYKSTKEYLNAQRGGMLRWRRE